jgi:glutamate 5-kinase
MGKFEHKQKLIVKVGTSVLADEGLGLLNENVIANIVRQLCELRSKGFNVLLVTSGAVGAGSKVLNTKVDSQLYGKHIYAAVGQVKLIALYEQLFSNYSQQIAQLLVMKTDLQARSARVLIKGTIEELWQQDVVPIINENDVTTFSGSTFTDNDELACLLGELLEVNQLTMLTNVKGVYKSMEEDKLIIKRIGLNDHLDFLNEQKSSVGRGGMKNKVHNALSLTHKGIRTVITTGKAENSVIDSLNSSGEFTIIE